VTWIDSHCHLPSLTGGADAALDRARAAGVERVVCVGTDLASSAASIELAARHDDVSATVGLHPHDASKLDAEWDDLVARASDPTVVAIGETGFDLYYEHSPVAAQEAAFRAQIALARQLDVALVIHTRDAWDDTFDVLAAEGVPDRTIFHCFTGGPDEARRCVGIGAFVSLSGIVTFKSAAAIQEAARLVPIERVLVETDSPYLAPVPHRGQPNRPAWVPFVGTFVADLRGIAPDTLVEQVSANIRAAFPAVAS